MEAAATSTVALIALALALVSMFSSFVVMSRLHDKGLLDKERQPKKAAKSSLFRM